MSKACEAHFASRPNRPAIALAIALMVFNWCVAGIFPAKAATAQDSLLREKSGVFLSFNHKLVARILTHLSAKNREMGDAELSRLLNRVRVAVPIKSLVEDYPNAYALADKEADWIIIDAGWVPHISAFAELAILNALPSLGEDVSSFAASIFNKFCGQYQEAYRLAIREGRPLPTYEFRFENFLSRTDPKYALDFLLFDTIRAAIWTNTFVWTVLHEVGHHALKHTAAKATPLSNQIKRQWEIKADKWAFGRMKDLGYSLFGVGHFFAARLMTDVCFTELGLVDDEKESTHPTWKTRYTALCSHFNILDAPIQDIRIFVIPQSIPDPIISILTIRDASSREFEAHFASLNQGGRVSGGITEWDGRKATVYLRAVTGGRIECIIWDAMRVLTLIEERNYDRNDHLVSSVKFFAFQQDSAIADLIQQDGVKISERLKRSNNRNLMVIHLRRVGMSESAIREALTAAEQFVEDRHQIFLEYVKGKISTEALRDQDRKKTNIYEQRLIGILGEKGYRGYVESLSKERESHPPGESGMDFWEEVIRKDYGIK